MKGRQFRASRKRKTWLATAASFAPTWLATASNLAALARFEEFEGFEAFGGTAASFAPEKEPLSLPQPLVWQLQEPLWHVSRV